MSIGRLSWCHSLRSENLKLSCPAGIKTGVSHGHVCGARLMGVLGLHLGPHKRRKFYHWRSNSVSSIPCVWWIAAFAMVLGMQRFHMDTVPCQLHLLV